MQSGTFTTKFRKSLTLKLLSSMEALYFISGIGCAFVFNKIIDTIQDVVVKIYLIKSQKKSEE